MGGEDLKDNRDTRGGKPPGSSHERYHELCALAITGTLTDREWNRLKTHLAQCRECTDALRKYREIARMGMPLLMSEESIGEHKGKEAWSPETAKRDLFARIENGDQVGWLHDAAIRSRPREPINVWSRFPLLRHAGLRYATLFAVAILALSSVYLFGVRVGRNKAQQSVTSSLQLPAKSSAVGPNPLLPEMQALKREKASLDRQLIDRNSQVEALSRKAQAIAAELALLNAAKQQDETQAAETLQQQRDEIAQANSRSASITDERDAITAKLRNAESTLASTKTALDRIREQRRSDLLYTAGLESRIVDLSERLKRQDVGNSVDAQLLASDRDIRELMGARDLYIADVFDVDPNGRTEKPFGRVFYTRRKSLIFYAFDLDKQRNAHNVSTFQAWGRRGLNDVHPVNMGIFYLDNETNRRWVLKFDDPQTLARIDTVFVTVEPKGGSEAPRGKPLLVASLRSQPNHP
jgi:hypothetical protein